MRLFRINTQFWGKDLDKNAILGYVVADSEKDVLEHINQHYFDGYWFGEEEDDPEGYEYNKQDYLANKGDSHTEFAGEFYDQKYGWEDLGEVTDDEIAVLSKLGITQELNMTN